MKKVYTFLFVIFLLNTNFLTAQSLKWTECFNSNKPNTWLRARTEVAQQWGIAYRYKLFYADSLQCQSTDSMQWIHHRYFTQHAASMYEYGILSDSLIKRHGKSWKLKFETEVEQRWQHMFKVEQGDSARYPYTTFFHSSMRTYNRDTIERGYINLSTLTYEKEKPVGANHFLTLHRNNKINFPEPENISLVKRKRRNKPEQWFMQIPHAGKNLRVPLPDTANIYFYNFAKQQLTATVIEYGQKLVIITQPLHFMYYEIILWDLPSQRTIANYWVGPDDSRLPEARTALADEVCDYTAQMLVHRYKHLLLVNINVGCDFHHRRDALHILNLDTREYKKFTPDQ